VKKFKFSDDNHDRALYDVNRIWDDAKLNFSFNIKFITLVSFLFSVFQLVCNYNLKTNGDSFAKRIFFRLSCRRSKFRVKNFKVVIFCISKHMWTSFTDQVQAANVGEGKIKCTTRSKEKNKFNIENKKIMHLNIKSLTTTSTANSSCAIFFLPCLTNKFVGSML
jgi:hypothetical protein